MRIRTRLATVALLGSAALATGCGGGGGGDPTPVTVTILSTAALDGHIHSTGDAQVGAAYYVAFGDYANALGPVSGVRAFVSFDLASIPAGATVVDATLTLFEKSTVGSPFTTLGDILLDHVVYGSVLEAGAYSRSGLGDAIATFPADVTPGPKTVSVTAAVAGDVGARPQSQYRLRFTVESDNDGDSDGISYYSSGTATTTEERPRLVVTYLP